MIRVSPSILAADFANLEREIGTIKQAGAEYVHIDVMDGLFVPNISIGLPVLSCIRKVTDLTLDVHLMIDRPVRYAERFCQAGADIVTVHVEADTQENTLEALRIIRACGKKPAICVKPKTPAEAVLPFIELVDLILVMTVEPGFGGQKFLPTTPARIAAIRAERARLGCNTLIEVDGGINTVTGPQCIEAGVDWLVAGNSLFRAEDPAAVVRVLHSK